MLRQSLFSEKLISLYTRKHELWKGEVGGVGSKWNVKQANIKNMFGIWLC